MSSSPSIWPSRYSMRSVASAVSRRCWRCSSFSCRWAAMVSARRPLSLISWMDDSTSPGMRLLSLANWSNCASRVRRSASLSAPVCSVSATGRIWLSKWLPLSYTLSARARNMPSTSTLTVPSGSFSTCTILAMVPVACISSGLGVSSLPLRWASRNTGLSASMAALSAATDFSRPTNSGSTMCG